MNYVLKDTYSNEYVADEGCGVVVTSEDIEDALIFPTKAQANKAKDTLQKACGDDADFTVVKL